MCIFWGGKGARGVRGRVKMREFCVYAFLKSKGIQAKNARKVRQNCLFTTTPRILYAGPCYYRNYYFMFLYDGRTS